MSLTARSIRALLARVRAEIAEAEAANDYAWARDLARERDDLLAAARSIRVSEYALRARHAA